MLNFATRLRFVLQYLYKSICVWFHIHIILIVVKNKQLYSSYGNI